MQRRINKIIIHCSDSPFGDVNVIRKWHLQRNFNDIGYHYVILNGHTESMKDEHFLESQNGSIETGRPIEYVGAHCRGENEDSIGICLVGRGLQDFTEEQFISLRNLVLELMDKYGLDITQVYGHYEFDPNKTCPCVNMNRVRKYIMDEISFTELNPKGGWADNNL